MTPMDTVSLLGCLFVACVQGDTADRYGKPKEQPMGLSLCGVKPARNRRGQ